jgi:hypothetical protein
MAIVETLLGFFFKKWIRNFASECSIISELIQFKIMIPGKDVLVAKDESKKGCFQFVSFTGGGGSTAEIMGKLYWQSIDRKKDLSNRE